MVCVSKMVKLNELKIFIYNIDVFVKYEKTEKYRIFLIWYICSITSKSNYVVILQIVDYPQNM